jgi:hypothetical protein
VSLSVLWVLSRSPEKPHTHPRKDFGLLETLNLLLLDALATCAESFILPLFFYKRPMPGRRFLLLFISSPVCQEGVQFQSFSQFKSPFLVLDHSFFANDIDIIQEALSLFCGSLTVRLVFDDLDACP